MKELLENSIDAQSTSIDIVVKNGGLNLLQITDNGTGINKDDLMIMCERYTTSKLQTFEDLSSIATYGFRGEALASISHIAHLTVTTKTKDSPSAWRAKYLDGKMAEKPNRTAGNVGTQITVENLFYNTKQRLKSFKNASEEYSKILDVVGKYAMHSQGIAFSCKRHGDTRPSLTIQKSYTIVERIRHVYESSIANELISINIECNDEYSFISGEGQITNANFSSKKSIPPVLFINHRLVTCDPLRKALNQVYNNYLPKGGRPFIYLSLEINPANVDVNIHPTKREVRFLFEEEIVELVCQKVEGVLSKADSSRSFQTQTVLPGVTVIEQATPVQRKIYEYNLVRTDSKQQKLTTLIDSQSTNKRRCPEELDMSADSLESFSGQDIEGDEVDDAIIETAAVKRNYRPSKLNSVKELRDAVGKTAHKALTQIFADHTFIGIVDFSRRLAAIQHDVKLYLIDYGAAAKELFYQIGLSDFENFGTINLVDQDSGKGLPVRTLLEYGHENLSDDGQNMEQEIDEGLATLCRFSEMLAEYFNVRIVGERDPVITTLPLLLNGYEPPIEKLPDFLYNLTKKVEWDEEKQCLDAILHELTAFYSPLSLPLEHEPHEENRVRTMVETFLFPAFKRRLVAPQTLTTYIVEIANLPGLYKVFERC